MVVIQSVFVAQDEDVQSLLRNLKAAYEMVSTPKSGMVVPNYLSILIKYFVCSLQLKTGDLVESSKTAREVLKEAK